MWNLCIIHFHSQGRASCLLQPISGSLHHPVIAAHSISSRAPPPDGATIPDTLQRICRPWLVYLSM